MYYFLLGALLYLYLLWRLRSNIRRRGEIRFEISWLTFLTACLLLWLVFSLAPGISQPAAAAVLLLTLCAVFALNLRLFRLYDRWLEEQEEK